MITDSDRSSPTPLKIATVSKLSMLAIDAAEARGKSLASAAVMSLSNIRPFDQSDLQKQPLVSG
jgi:transketolase C-terminal domain/subunit